MVRLRENIEASLRQSVLDSREPDLMSTWTRSAWGADDYDMWRAQLDALGPASPLRPLAAGQLARLDREFGIIASVRGQLVPGQLLPRQEIHGRLVQGQLVGGQLVRGQLVRGR